VADQNQIPTLILGAENPAIVALNKINRERWDARRKQMILLNAQFPVAILTYDRISRSVAFVQSAASPAEQIQRLRGMRGYYEETTEAAADVRLVLEAYKQHLSHGQKGRAKFKRAKVGDSQIPIRDLVAKLIANQELREEKPAELWPHWISLLQEEGCSPKQKLDSKGRPWIEYDFFDSKNKRNTAGEGIRTMRFLTFANIVYDLRKPVSPAIV
jgi:hypothetical protein